MPKKKIGLCVFLILAMVTTSCMSGSVREKFKERRQLKRGYATESPGPGCDGSVPEIVQGYGSEGQYGMDIQTMDNPLWKGEQISVFFPRGLTGPLPVLFFSHAYGASDWKRAYTPFMHHMASRGYIVVFSPYQTLGASYDERYETLWKGFETAVQRFGQKMDLSRVGFIGHSFGGGATPAMAYEGLVNRKWGQKGAFMYILAPWYSFQISSEKMRQFPGHTVLMVQVYDKDDTNDHRMAIDIYDSISLPDHQKHFQVVRSQTINGCELRADHATPSKNPSLRLKQYAVFRPLDALADYVFNGNPEGNKTISATIPDATAKQYQPLFLEKNPAPRYPESTYRFPWSDKKNPRRSLKNW